MARVADTRAAGMGRGCTGSARARGARLKHPFHCTWEGVTTLSSKISLESFKGKLTNLRSLFNSPVKCHFPRETS